MDDGSTKNDAREMPLAALPEWLIRQEGYTPRHDKTGFMAKNMLHLTGMLKNVQMGGGSAAIQQGLGPSSPLDRALSRVSPALRLAGLIVCILLVLMSHSRTFLMLMGCADLVLIACRPAGGIKATMFPSLGAAAVAALLAVPAAFFGGPGGSLSMAFIAAKVFLNVSLVVGLSWAVPWNGLVGALGSFHVPDEFIFTLDIALKHIEILGRAATTLSESLVLRSAGHTRGHFEKTTSSAGVMGATFLRAYACGRALEEAMTCRGFTGSYVRRRERVMTAAGAVYLCGLVLLVVAYLALG